MIKYLLGLSMITVVSACHAEQPTETTSDFALHGLTEAASHTNYLAKIQHNNVTKENTVDSKTDEEFEKHIYSAKVIKTYRGVDATEIRYEMSVDKGEDTVLETTPIIVALCINKQGQLYWPGTGSQFPVNKTIEAWLNQPKNTLPQNSDNSWCDDLNK